MIKKEDVLNVAKLSSFELSEKDIEKFTQELGNIVNILDRLVKIDTEGVEPMYSSLETTNIFREDLHKKYENSKELIELSEYVEDNVIVVPKVVG